MRKRTVRSGLRLLTLSVMLLLLGTFYSQQINAFLAVGGNGTVEFIKLAFFWGAMLGAAAILMISFGLLQRTMHDENVRLKPALFFLTLLLALFFALFYRSFTAPPPERPLRPGETLVI